MPTTIFNELYYDGFIGFALGASISDCPYHPGSPEADAWLAGFIGGKVNA